MKARRGGDDVSLARGVVGGSRIKILLNCPQPTISRKVYGGRREKRVEFRLQRARRPLPLRLRRRRRRLRRSPQNCLCARLILDPEHLAGQVEIAVK